jgi:hypothetical protein
MRGSFLPAVFIGQAELERAQDQGQAEPPHLAPGQARNYLGYLKAFLPWGINRATYGIETSP